MHIIEYPALPFATPIYNLNHDAVVHVHAEPVPGPTNGFVVEFPSNEGIAFHFNVRMGNCGERTVVFNNFKHGHWKHEERHHNHFHFGQYFHLKISNHHRHFSVHVNGHHLGHFHHRESPHHIHQLAVRGDLRVHKIHFENFDFHNGGGIQIGGGAGMPVPMGVVPTPIAVAPTPVMAYPTPAPPPPVVFAPPPVVQPAPVIYAPPVVQQPQVVIIEEEHHRHRRHHHHHGLLHHLFD
ncbi:unnamed protein product [Caenorhabditis auriculariae]|uniref:Galectin n=1 Tax=Caenorhabditis auriculariae TaxID=2777116 RepID=A0A8S1HWE4_9PELO|nr:unnamed protein product [Caenorhabditis auriculariae]